MDFNFKSYKTYRNNYYIQCLIKIMFVTILYFNKYEHINGKYSLQNAPMILIF